MAPQQARQTRELRRILCDAHDRGLLTEASLRDAKGELLVDLPSSVTDDSALMLRAEGSLRVDGVLVGTLTIGAARGAGGHVDLGGSDAPQNTFFDAARDRSGSDRGRAHSIAVTDRYGHDVTCGSDILSLLESVEIED